MSRVVTFRVGCVADLTETWQVDLPDQPMTREDIEEYVMGELSAGEARFIEDEPCNERDRELLEVIAVEEASDDRAA